MKTVAAKARLKSATRIIPAVVGSVRGSPTVTIPKIRLITDKTERARRSSAIQGRGHSYFKERINAKTSVSARSRMLVTFI